MSSKFRARGLEMHAGVIVYDPRTPERQRYYLKRHVDAVHDGSMVASCQACKELSKPNETLRRNSK